MSACLECLQRSELISSLSGRIEVLRKRRRYIRDVLALSDRELMAAVGVGSSPTPRMRTADELRSSSQVARLQAICRHAADYPARLVSDPSAPAVLYVAGSLRRWRELLVESGGSAPPVVAIVGTRKASQDGLEAARVTARGLSVAGVTVVSGMALGIDGAAHDGALAGGGRTVAVLAGGADIPYPERRRATHAEIIERGAVVSEAPPGARAFPWSFLARNRIIAGLADATLVVEAAERSGSLVTAEMALELGRDVGAVPGTPLSWRSCGTNELLREGATLVRDAEDVLDLLFGAGARTPTALLTEALPADLAAILSEVRGGVGLIDELAADHGGAAAVQVALVDLELRGYVVRRHGGRFVSTEPAMRGA